MTSNEIYNEHYAPAFASLFIEHPLWQPKLTFNAQAISSLLKPLGIWLDTCCGQGWHLARFPGHRRVGIDASGAQLERARRKNPGVPFIEADVAAYEFPGGQQFDLVTNFWSSYAYLNEEGIRALVRKLVRWTAPGGALYVELTIPETLEEFNESEFAAETGTKVVMAPDGIHWQFHDPGGIHQMTSPGVAFFDDLIAPHFASVDSAVVIRSIRQYIARNRKPDG